jgi:hypothetical protein
MGLTACPGAKRERNREYKAYLKEVFEDVYSTSNRIWR